MRLCAQAVPMRAWLVPCTLMCALVAAAAAGLELRQQKLLRSGAYNPRSHTLCHLAPLPLARVRTSREPLGVKDTKKSEQPGSARSWVLGAFSTDGGTPGQGSDCGTPLGSGRGSFHGGGGVGGGMAMLARGPIGVLMREAHSSGSSSGGGGPDLTHRRSRASNASNAGASVVTGFPGERSLGGQSGPCDHL
jgi:hypothetical protein